MSVKRSTRLRSMRRVKPGPTAEEVQRKIIDAAIRSPTGGDWQGRRFALVDGPQVRGRMAERYPVCIDHLVDDYTNYY